MKLRPWKPGSTEQYVNAASTDIRVRIERERARLKRRRKQRAPAFDPAELPAMLRQQAS